MKRYEKEKVQARVTPVSGEYLRTQYYLDRDPAQVTVGMGEDWTPLACKEVYGRGVKTALESIGIRLADHIIVADGDFVSMADSGYLD